MMTRVWEEFNTKEPGARIDFAVKFSAAAGHHELERLITFPIQHFFAESPFPVPALFIHNTSTPRICC